MYPSLRFPAQLSKAMALNRCNHAFKQYCLNPNPLNASIVQPNHFKNKPTERKQEWFVNDTFELHRGEKKSKDGQEFTIRVRREMNKKELKQYFEKIYGLEVEKVTTINYMGKIKRSARNTRYREKDFKKAYIRLSTPVPSYISHMDRNSDD